jgi:hypothetical protein
MNQDRQILERQRDNTVRMLASLQDSLYEARLSSAPDEEISDLTRRVREALDRRIELDAMLSKAGT